MTHTGTIGLFDDDDEYDAVMKRNERHERQHLESVVRRQERHESRQQRKEAKAADGAAKGKPELSRPASWIARLFHRGKEPALQPKSTRNKDGDEISITTEYVVVRRPSTPEIVYTAGEIDPVDSPWLRECGMVRVISDDAGGCHVVPKSRIQKND
jgi:hypothetical protein